MSHRTGTAGRPGGYLRLALRPGVDTYDVFQARRGRQRRVGDDDIVNQHNVGSSLVIGAFEDIDSVRPKVVSLQDPLHLLPPLHSCRARPESLRGPGHAGTGTAQDPAARLADPPHLGDAEHADRGTAAYEQPAPVAQAGPPLR